MTKSTGVGRGKGGGGSHGGGRPRKIKLPPPDSPIKTAAGASGAAAQAERVIAAAAPPTDASAADLLKKAYRTLDVVMDCLEFPNARVAAAKAIIANVAISREETTQVISGKRDAQAEAAKSTGVGRFATPPAPRLN